ncbi:hypothetical protein BHM03_00033339 [Ensete ventricosum]|nr:hypothetical protein BHM03_00033339 [Ensete ventricosum]
MPFHCRLGLRCLVLESSDTLRAAGFALSTWTNAWRALDALGVGDTLRKQHVRLEAGDDELRCVRRNLLVEALAKELPQGTIRYSSKVVSMEDAGGLKLLHLADGSTLRAKVLIGCDGINSAVAKWLGLKEPTFSGRCAARGFAMFEEGHGFKPVFTQYFGRGCRAGLLPCDDNNMYWFVTWAAGANEMKKDAVEVKEFVLRKLKSTKIPQEVVQVVERSELSSVASAHLRYRSPFDLLWGDVSRGNVCVTGDAFHPMTPDIGQGGCSALEDGVVLAKCLGEALIRGREGGGGEEDQGSSRVEAALKKYADARRWRSFELVATAYVMGVIQQGGNWATRLLRDQLLPGAMANKYTRLADFDCGKL